MAKYTDLQFAGVVSCDLCHGNDVESLLSEYRSCANGLPSLNIIARRILLRRTRFSRLGCTILEFGRVARENRTLDPQFTDVEKISRERASNNTVPSDYCCNECGKSPA